ncbi:MAG: phosphoenolpyruvate carboxykinase (GTP), partial [Planctomycetes bacterium]|nr:phosphoenolpyruvate carboxykinase (GTP) [Planctomycetota bacterium]
RRLTHPPRIYSVNWFRADDDGRFLWPGFGENIRVLKWIIDRVNNRVGAKETPIGLVPDLGDLELDGLSIEKTTVQELFEVNPEEWEGEIAEIQKFLTQFGDRLPREIQQELDTKKAWLQRARRS